MAYQITNNIMTKIIYTPIFSIILCYNACFVPKLGAVSEPELSFNNVTE